MAYTINKTDGTILATVADGTINTDTSITIVGKNYAGYGEFLNENMVKLLESGANTSQPSAPLTGQLWFDKTNGLLTISNTSATVDKFPLLTFIISPCSRNGFF